ncbi:hypothetical protein BDV96DRAFT_639919 [Lophiotrema nucula]|uniref:Uncharacterized protein n=1 Tax=Lophiotrema nucula TaxID=690887 RepID=A0A6A5ZRV0_9PLEO|nr:hypothetical protein BDV96DRAFT_639919 [Lophiotrema nucula]
MEDKRDWEPYVLCISYVAWNKSVEEARKGRKNCGCSGGKDNGIRIILDESTVGHPRIMYTDKNTGQEKEIQNGKLRGQFQQAMDNGSSLHITKGFLSGLRVHFGYVDYELKDGGTIMRQRRKFQYETVLDFAFGIADIQYGCTKWLQPHTDRIAFAALHGSREMRGIVGDVLINNELFGGQDPEYGTQKTVVV